MRPEIENLKAMVYQREMNIHQKAQAIEEFLRLQSYVTEIEQCVINGVGCSSDLIVIELSDEELKIVTRQELEQMEKDAMDFDGFEGWLVRGLLVK